VYSKLHTLLGIHFVAIDTNKVAENMNPDNGTCFEARGIFKMLSVL
jgi:hypothetical protein